MTELSVGFVHHSLQRGGGSEKVIFDVISRLDPTQVRPVLICMYDAGVWGEELRRRGYTVHSNLMRRAFDVAGMRRVSALLRREGCQVMYVSDGFMNMITGRLAAEWAGTKVSVLGFHSYDSFLRRYVSRPRRLLLNFTDAVFVPRFDRYVALSPRHREYLCEVKGVPWDKVTVIENGVEVDSPESLGGDERRDPDLVAIVGGLRRWKGHETFLAAAARVATHRTGTRFVVAGDGPERQRLEALSRHLEVASIDFLGNVTEVRSLMARASVVVLSSWTEAYPLTLLEAMAEGAPVVATDVGSVAEMVGDGDSGFVVPPGQPDLLAEAILRLLRDRELADRVGLAGRARVEARFRVEESVARYQTLFLELGLGT